VIEVLVEQIDQMKEMEFSPIEIKSVLRFIYTFLLLLIVNRFLSTLEF